MLCPSHHHHNHHHFFPGIRDVVMRKVRDQIIIIHKDSTKRFDQLYHMLYSNPHLGHQFHLRSWFSYCWLSVFSPYFKSKLECRYYIRSYPPIIITCVLEIILSPVGALLIFAAMFILPFLTTNLVAMFILVPLYLCYFVDLNLAIIYCVLAFIITLIFLPWYSLSGLIFPKNIELSIVYYRDMFGSNLDLDPPVIIDEMSDKLRDIVDNYIPLPSTTSFDYLRFVKETNTITYRYSGEDNVVHEVKKKVTGSFIEFIKHD
jgi:hypothetical protein